MAEDGYEVMGPGGNAPKPPAPVQIAPPPPPPIALKSVQEKTSSTIESPTKTKKKSKSKKDKTEKTEEDVGDGTSINQRPNSCDTILLSITCVVFILIIAASIPILLTAFGIMDIEAIKLKLEGKTSQ